MKACVRDFVGGLASVEHSISQQALSIQMLSYMICTHCSDSILLDSAGEWPTEGNLATSFDIASLAILCIIFIPILCTACS